MGIDLIIASLMVVLTVIIHFIGLFGLLRLLDVGSKYMGTKAGLLQQCALVIIVVLGLVAIHTIEIWLYALMFLTIGAISSFEPALYFSTVTFSTLGYGDIVLDQQWRVLGAIEAANGLILFGWSTAFLISVMGRMHVLEHDWTGRSQR